MDRITIDSTSETLTKEARRTGKAQVAAIEDAPGHFFLFAALPVSKSIPWNSAPFDSISRKLQDAAYDAVAEVYGSERYLDMDGYKGLRIQDFHGFLCIFKIDRSTEKVDLFLRSFENRANRALGDGGERQSKTVPSSKSPGKPWWKVW